jgi:hypothetical protein
MDSFGKNACAALHGCNQHGDEFAASQVQTSAFKIALDNSTVKNYLTIAFAQPDISFL